MFSYQKAADVKKQLTERRDQLYAQQKQSQPFLVFVGPNLTNIKEYHVDIAGVLYRFTSAAKALDTCLKSYMSLHLEYPLESRRVWMFLQRVLCNINTSWDNDVPYGAISSYNGIH